MDAENNVVGDTSMHAHTHLTYVPVCFVFFLVQPPLK